MENSGVYGKVNDAWKKTSKVLLGEELGEMEEYEGWLTSDLIEPREEKSGISGKNVYLGNREYCNGKFLGLDEVDFKKKFEPLDINEIKDIDSIVGALQERFYY